MLREIRPPSERPFRIEEVPIPPLVDGAVLGRMVMAGVCGTDVHILHGKVPVKTPAILGHENVARVEAIGGAEALTDITGKPVREGDLITWLPKSCMRCYNCTILNDQAKCERRIGYGGWVPAASRVQNTGTTPQGTFGLTTAFGLSADPGTALPYRRADADDHWVGDQRDPRTYNLFQPAASAGRTWRTGQAERLAAYPTQYQYAVVIDFNRPAASTVAWQAVQKQFVTSRPVNVRLGSAIFLHVNGAGSTAGCVSIARADMVRVLTWLDPARRPRIVMAPESAIGTA
jgi:L,D-peptidoglycan transpeptidase YkuD (ErfK/YbiS/YcfS/YnhG family)